MGKTAVAMYKLIPVGCRAPLHCTRGHMLQELKLHKCSSFITEFGWLSTTARRGLLLTTIHKKRDTRGRISRKPHRLLSSPLLSLKKWKRRQRDEREGESRRENAAEELIHAIPALLPLLLVPFVSASPPCLLRQPSPIPPPVDTQRRRRPPHGALLLHLQHQGRTAGGAAASPRSVRVRAGAGSADGAAGAAAVPGEGPRHRPHRLRPVHCRRRQAQDDGRAGREGGRAGRAVQEDGGRAARERDVPAQLRAVPARGEGRPQEGRGVLFPRHARGPQRRRDHVAVRQAGLAGAPRQGEIPQLLPEVGAGCPAEQPCARCVRQLPVGAGRRRLGRRRTKHEESGTGERNGNRASAGAGFGGRVIVPAGGRCRPPGHVI